MLNELLGCPFCGSHPLVQNYPTMIRIYCLECKTKGREVEAVGDGYYSEWCRQQEPDEKGLVTLAPELFPVSDTGALRRVIDVWNERPALDPL